MDVTGPGFYFTVLFCTLPQSFAVCRNIMYTISPRNPSQHIGPRQNGLHFPDDIFKFVFLDENVWISLKISLKFVTMERINNIPALVEIMAWRRPGDKPLSEPMIVRLQTHICVTRPQWDEIKLSFQHTCLLTPGLFIKWEHKLVEDVVNVIIDEANKPSLYPVCQHVHIVAFWLQTYYLI